MSTVASVNPIEVEKFLKGMDYPADKNAITNKAKENGASAEIIDALNKIEEGEYNSPTEVNEALSDVTSDYDEFDYEDEDEEDDDYDDDEESN
ncbi:MAG: DUF2795 domain-containing protein [Alphaproteobacteria bacterium]|nr:DUF2795 domain-containing protein [Alphaproteobacteria bacterium]OJV12127.1 MAG: hypothetical protein BGO27_05245 [Alphaproteobacteria bacterium 33-17]